MQDLSTEYELEQHHKQLVTRYVLPTMTGLAAVFIAATVRLDTRVVCGLAIGVICAMINQFLTVKNRIWKIGPYSIESRSDVFDLVRWSITLIFADVPMMLLVYPSQSVLFGFWAVLILSAQLDTYSKRHRNYVSGLGIVLGIVCFSFLYPALSILELGFIFFSLCALLGFARIVESFWRAELFARKEAQDREIESKYVADQLQRDAFIGEHVKMMAHEVGNLMMSIDLATANPKEVNTRVIRKTLDYIQKINSLILNDLNKMQELKQTSVRSLVESINMMLRKQVEHQEIVWQVEPNPAVQEEQFIERSGSVYLIIQNLINNSCRAIKALNLKPLEGRVTIHLQRQQDLIVIGIQDNGCGMDPQMRENILEGRMDKIVVAGHGMGLRFVLSESQKNGFELDIETQKDRGTTFWVKIPVAGSPKSLFTRRGEGGGSWLERTAHAVPAPHAEPQQARPSGKNVS